MVDLAGWQQVSLAGFTLLVDCHCHMLGRPCWLTASVTCSFDITGRLPVPRTESTLLVHCLWHFKFHAPTLVCQGHLNRTSYILMYTNVIMLWMLIGSLIWYFKWLTVILGWNIFTLMHIIMFIDCRSLIYYRRITIGTSLVKIENTENTLCKLYV